MSAVVDKVLSTLPLSATELQPFVDHNRQRIKVLEEKANHHELSLQTVRLEIDYLKKDTQELKQQLNKEIGELKQQFTDDIRELKAIFQAANEKLESITIKFSQAEGESKYKGKLIKCVIYFCKFIGAVCGLIGLDVLAHKLGIK